MRWNESEVAELSRQPPEWEGRLLHRDGRRAGGMGKGCNSIDAILSKNLSQNHPQVMLGVLRLVFLKLARN